MGPDDLGTASLLRLGSDPEFKESLCTSVLTVGSVRVLCGRTGRSLNPSTTLEMVVEVGTKRLEGLVEYSDNCYKVS